MTSKLRFIRPSWPTPTNVNALVTTRVGGLSRAPFDSLNVGLHVDDDPEIVTHNRQMLSAAAELPSEPIWLKQTHGVDVIQLRSNHSEKTPSYDGAITSVENVVCAVMTADCLPLFLSSSDGQQVGVIHVGWRGLAQGIIENSIAMFECEPEQLIAWAGPCISLAHFEIGAEVREQLGGSDEAYRPSSNQGKYYADMYKLVGQVLAKSGLTNYSSDDYCTYRDSELFYSYRREQVTGRMVSLIWKG